MEWMQEEVLNVSKNTQDAVIRKNLFHTKSYEMILYQENFAKNVATDIVI